MKQSIALVLLLALLLTGCGSSTKNLMSDVPAQVVCLAEVPNRDVQLADLSLRLLQNTMEEGKNTLISPLSILSALGMAANGASGNTLEQMAQAFDLTLDDLNACLYAILDSQGEELQIANSLWLKDSPTFRPNPNFLETNASLYRAGVFQTPMDDSTLKAINQWVSDHTAGRIPEILDSIPDNATAYLVNALAFDGKWETPYQDAWPRDFTLEDGTQVEGTLMWSQERQYLEHDNAVGFCKPYQGGRYVFAAILPEEGLPLQDYVNSLDGESLLALLENVQDVKVDAGMQKFESRFDADLVEALKNMGITDAFDPSLADFSCLGVSDEGPLYISRVLHKTTVTVAEEGTEAAASTIVEMAEGEAIEVEEVKTVCLNRPFLYLILDTQSALPVFMGTMMNPALET